jgi:hypothetical protein
MHVFRALVYGSIVRSCAVLTCSVEREREKGERDTYNTKARTSQKMVGIGLGVSLDPAFVVNKGEIETKCFMR